MQHNVVIFPQLSMKHDVTMFDVGQGECILIRSKRLHGFLIDCGAKYPQYHSHVPCLVETSLPTHNVCGLAISHYHCDHYNLFAWFTRHDELFSNIYVPDMPTVGPSRHITYAIMKFLAVANLINFSNYRILPDIFTTCRRPIVPRKKGDIFQEADLSFHVFWPDPNHQILKAPSIVKRAETVTRKINPWIEKYRIQIADRDEGISMEEFFGLIQELRHREVQEPERREVEKTLWGLEETFRSFADLLSLAFTSFDCEHDERFLFLGDLTNRVLNQITIPIRYRAFNFVKASHHGTRFGKSLLKISTEFLLVSRNQREHPQLNSIHKGYFHQMRSRIVLNTEFLNDCYITNGRMLIGK
jgi:hypothetical protein